MVTQVMVDTQPMYRMHEAFAERSERKSGQPSSFILSMKGGVVMYVVLCLENSCAL